MNAALLLLHLALGAQTPIGQPHTDSRHVRPVLAFPEPALDDSAAYAGYETRLFRDAARNTVQIYVDGTHGRVVQLWADAENESAGFTSRGADGKPIALDWAGDGADVGRRGRTRSIAFRLRAPGARVTLGGFLLGSMRVERDFQYAGRQKAPFSEPAFRVVEMSRLVDALARLEPAARTRQLALLHARTLGELRARLVPHVAGMRAPGGRVARVTQVSLDGVDTLTLEFDPSSGTREIVRGDSVMLTANRGGVDFTVRSTTTGGTLTPLSRDEIFTPAFLAFVDSLHRASAGDSSSAAGIRARRIERQVRGVELLASREKLMAGLPTYATYFGRDIMMSSLMMRPIWRSAVAEAVINAVLRKLGPNGEVSHEEALGGQAIREASAEYASVADSAGKLARAGHAQAARALVARERELLRTIRRTRENYHMLDDKFQFPIVVGRWLDDSTIPAAHKHAFLLDSSDGGGTRVARLMRELGYVARLSAPYANDPTVLNLVSFERTPAGWRSASWRDSGDGYANGRFAMDINAIWVPHALEAMSNIFADLRTLGVAPESFGAANDSALAGYLHDQRGLDHAIANWRDAERRFVVHLAPDEIRRRVGARLAAMPEVERTHWNDVLARTGADGDSLTFLALSLDAEGHPIGVANTDPATRLFLGETERAKPVDDSAAVARVLRDVRVFERAYPVGLLIDKVGPVVANDAYATPRIWKAFDNDRYHGTRVVWGREVNLFLLGAANRFAAAGSDRTIYKQELRDAAARIRAAVAASGFHSELWSYDFVNGQLVPMRYGSGADVQLWSTTDLAVEYELARLGW